MLHAMERDAQHFCYDAGGSEFGNGSHGTTHFHLVGNKNLLREADCSKYSLKPYDLRGKTISGAGERLRALDQARLATVPNLVAPKIPFLLDAKER